MRPGVVQHGEFHSAEQAGGETVSMAITTVLSQRYVYGYARSRGAYHCGSYSG